MSRKIFRTAVAAIALVGTSAAAFAQDVTLTLHHFMSPKSPPHAKFLEPWAEKVASESDGRIKVEIFPSMAMGGKPPELYRQVRDGAADIILTITGYTPGVFPRSEVFELPTVHQNSALATTKAITNNFELVAEDYKDVHPLLVFTNAGNAIHTTEACIEGPSDLENLKLRTPSRTGAWLIEEWNAIPIGLPVPTLPEALSKGVVEGALLPFEIMPPYKIHELTNCSVTAAHDGRFGASVFLFAMNKERYDELPDDLKAVLDANSGVAIAPQVGQLMNDIEAPGKKLQAGTGSPVNELDENATAAIYQAGKAVVARWIEEANAAGLDGAILVDTARGTIAENSQ
jgi:TRAP-type C4-dicarboxylate transport system substrate-binding protein